MPDTGVEASALPSTVAGGTALTSGPPPVDRQRTYRLVLATVWLLDALLQIQPFMFTRGADGFSGMLHGMAVGNPGWIAHTITWNGSIVYHQPIVTDAVVRRHPVPHRLRHRLPAHVQARPGPVHRLVRGGVVVR